MRNDEAALAGAAGHDREQIADLLRRHCYTFTREEELQAGVAQVLTDAGIRVEREVDLGDGCRVDLYLPDLYIAVELKVGGSALSVARQIRRYLSQPLLHVILVTSKVYHALYLEELERVSFVGTWEGSLG